MDEMLKKTMAFLTKHGDISEVESKLPKYWKAINDELLLADKSYLANDKVVLENHCKRAMSYHKKAIKVLQEIK
jgi:hypothetical protein